MEKRIRIIGSRPKDPSFVSLGIMWYENETRKRDFFRYMFRGKIQDDDISHIAILVDDTIYEAVKKGFLPIPFDKWKEENLIIWEGDPIAEFNLGPAEADYIDSECKRYVKKETRYGFFTLLGIVLNDKLGLKWFADGERRGICSEIPARICRAWIELLDKPFDYYTPEDNIKLFRLKFVFRPTS